MFQSYAIIPAAGSSSRMGCDKLLLPWGPCTLIEHVLSVWFASRIARAIVIVRPDDSRLRDCCRAAGAEVVTPDVPPSEMKVSVQIGLRYVEQRYAPPPTDVWLLAPADMPRLSSRVIDALLEDRMAHAGCILAPTCGGTRRGHPVLFPWPLAAEVQRLAPSESIRTLLDRFPVQAMDTHELGVLEDVDTPEDYRRALIG